MQTFKVDSAKLVRAAEMIKEGNKLTSDAKKLVDAGKETIIQWLKDCRNVNLDTCKIGEMFLIDNICLVEIGKQNKLNQDKLTVDQPELVARYKEDIACKKFKPLV